jgi:hypothetical protein
MKAAAAFCVLCLLGVTVLSTKIPETFQRELEVRLKHHEAQRRVKTLEIRRGTVSSSAEQTLEIRRGTVSSSAEHRQVV